MLPIASGSGQAVVAVIILAALLFLVWLLREEARMRGRDDRPPGDR
jgi:hypothetical protein